MFRTSVICYNIDTANASEKINKHYMNTANGSE